MSSPFNVFFRCLRSWPLATVLRVNLSVFAPCFYRLGFIAADIASKGLRLCLVPIFVLIMSILRPEMSNPFVCDIRHPLLEQSIETVPGPVGKD